MEEQIKNCRIILGDNMEYMKGISDKYFDLAVVDPPYQIERFSKPSGNTRFSSSKAMQEEGLKWDKVPSKEYFDELFRISKQQIVWGANNFCMPKSEYFIIWDKQQTVDNFACAEYAWVSPNFKKPAKIFRYSIHKHNHTDKIHPTQKPIKLYEWIYLNYAKEGMKILDTHLGSGSSAIAAHKVNMNLEFVGIEIDEEYYNNAVKRIKWETSQGSLF